ncbi:ElaB/YqjD/DUF883 family membrane-anchored ribosome-binding protein [Pararhizobium capsulatum DSM 1112]|uniref:ElaB/YqjD/DUF883 family membrane-anchored ribosome-binding protein n=1 Tax=Pararhizobium capsulatum DSM 1112 TaxID=1121113 RepID=A0ABU0BJA9_9HYPH|nr:hypothetical protein [Pararhizobium capsulatum]MDQ0318333.1 ElaB/YqjD/DUF883 family membrane-anchored ribosome-binding protein [Pararhizobium capsulatum DSM 1112]
MAIESTRDLDALREEVARLSKIVSAQSAEAYSDLRDRASSVADAAAPVARKAAAVAKAEGSAIAQTAREHPAAAGSVVFVAAAAGMVIGYILGAASQPEPPRRRYW